MFPEGICLSLIEEFDKILGEGKAYSYLPLARLSESNSLVAQSLVDNSETTLSDMTSLANNMLTRAANKPGDIQEVIPRPALHADSVDEAGNLVLCRPSKPSQVAISKATKGVKVYYNICMSHSVLWYNI